MATTKVHAPNATFTGEVAGVVFTDGVGELDDKKAPAARRYFERHGYSLGRRAKADDDDDQETQPQSAIEEEAAGTSPDARDHAGPVQIGTPLRDAAVDPEPGDFLPPINAGKADPHGPRVVAPEIHHPGPKGIKPGDVHVDDAKEQEHDERELAEAVLVAGEQHPMIDASDDVDRGPLGMSDPGSVEQGETNAAPAKNANTGAWRDYAIAQGMDPDEASEATRADLVERFG